MARLNFRKSQAADIADAAQRELICVLCEFAFDRQHANDFHRAAGGIALHSNAHRVAGTAERENL